MSGSSMWPNRSASAAWAFAMSVRTSLAVAVAPVHHDVRVHARDGGVAHPKTLEFSLINQTTCAHAVDLLEDGAGARVKFVPRMACAALREVLQENALQRVSLTAKGLERRAAHLGMQASFTME